MPAQPAVATNEIRKEAREPRKLRASNSQTEAFAEHEMANPILGECSAEAKPVAPKPQANVDEDAAAAHHQKEGSGKMVQGSCVDASKIVTKQPRIAVSRTWISSEFQVSRTSPPVATEQPLGRRHVLPEH